MSSVVEKSSKDVGGYFFATVEAATAVFHSIYAHFLGLESHNLVVSKTNRLEVYEIEEGGLNAKLLIPINGRITTIKRIQMANQLDQLFICTEKERFCILQYDDKVKGKIKTIASGDLHDRACRPIEKGLLVTTDTNGTLIALHLVQGLVKLLSIDGKGSLKEPLNRRIEELQVIDLVLLLDTGADYTLAILHETISGAVRITTYKVSKRGCELELGPWTFEELEFSSHTLVAVPPPRGGVIVISDEALFYYNHTNKAQCAVAMKPTRITCHCRIDDNGYRYLLGDSEGSLYVLILFGEGDNSENGGGGSGGGGRVDSLKLEYLGQTVIPSTITYLDNGFVYIGSHFGESQIIRLSSTRLEDGGFVEIIDSLKSSSPIVDFTMVDLERIGQNSVVACSGAFKEGNIRFIRKGSKLTLNSIAELDFTSLRIFSLKYGPNSLIFLTSLGMTKIIRYTKMMSGGGGEEQSEELEELAQLEKLNVNDSSLLIASKKDLLIQVTTNGVIRGDTLWRTPFNEKILAADTFEEHLVVAMTGSSLAWLNCSIPKQRPMQTCRLFTEEISALCLVSIDGAIFAIIARWACSNLMITNASASDETSIVGKVELGTSVLVRSLKFSVLNGKAILFIGFGDGSIMNCELFLDKDRVIQAGPLDRAILGTGPVEITKTLVGQDEMIFAFCDRPLFIITFIRERIYYSLTNIKDCRALVGLAGGAAGELIIARDSDLLLCSLEGESSRAQLHHQVIALGETATRIVHIASAKAYTVLTTNQCHPEYVEGGGPKVSSRILLMDQEVMKKLDVFELPINERAHSMTTIYLPAQGTQAIIVGTAMITGPGQEPQSGRILTFIIGGGGGGGRSDRKLQLLGQTSVPGCVYALASIDNGKLVAAINGMTGLYRWVHVEGEHFSWSHLHSHFGQILGVKLDVKDRLVAVGDLMKSVNLLCLDDGGEKLVEIARDYEPNWMTEVRLLDSDHILGADSLGNIFVLVRRRDLNFTGERYTLTMEFSFHLGEVVNRIVAGTLTRQQQQQPSQTLPLLLSNPHLIGSTCGGLYFFGSLTEREFKILKVVQRNMNLAVNSIGGLSHSDWRALATERRKPRSMETFIDGDLIGGFLQLPPDIKLAVAEGDNSLDYEATGATITEVLTLVEALLAAYQ